MNKLIELINGHQRQLLFSVNQNANQRGFSRVFSARRAVWERCVAEVSLLLTSRLLAEGGISPGQVDQAFINDPIAAYGVRQAQTHARYQLSISSFLSGLQCFRRGFDELLERTSLSCAERDKYQVQLNNFFDRIELGFCWAWEPTAEITQHEELQVAGG